ncbi:hypothetical protein [Spirosoma spitsbergense]|jgi:hypothetical protein|uniref:hypothetical protein n=1 Tax=Spirosoma spitsbergense TaxID=431554 RepID=UPI000364F957|nr:hypothetical protein [Spirosoma spitsbergense]
MDNSRWQRRLLPYMSRMLLGLALFFFVASLLQLTFLQGQMAELSPIDPTQSIDLIPTRGSHAEQIESARLKAAILLQTNSQRQLYHQATIGLMVRTWLRYLGFVTGMILAIVGATFILGKLDTDTSELNVKSASVEGSIKSSSPGLILVLLGTLLMMAAILVNHQIGANEAPIYLDSEASKSRVGDDEQLLLPTTEPKKDTINPFRP